MTHWQRLAILAAAVVLVAAARWAVVPKGEAATALPEGRPLSIISISYASGRPVVGTLVELVQGQKRFVIAVDEGGRFVLRAVGDGKPFVESVPLNPYDLQGDPVRWTLEWKEGKLIINVQAIQKFATPFQSASVILPDAWADFRPTEVARGTIESVVERLVVRVNGVIVSSGAIEGGASASLQDPGVVEYVIQPVRNFSVGIGMRPAGLIVNNANGIITLQWDRYVDPLHLPRAGDIGFEIERSVDRSPFERIEVLVAPSLSARERLVPGTIPLVYDPIDLTSVRGKELTYRIRTVGLRERSDPAESSVAVKETDLALEEVRLIDAHTAGCDGVVFSYTVVNRGYRQVGAFLTMLVSDGSAERRNGFGFSPFYIIDPNDFSRSRGRQTIGAAFQPGSRIERTECLGALAVDRLHHIRVTADSTGGEAQMMLSEPSGGVPFRYTENMIAEDDETNNSADLSFVLKRCGEQLCIQPQEGTALELPDLVVENLQIRERTLTSVKFVYDLFNRGIKMLASDSPFVVSYWVDGQELSRQEVARDWVIADGQTGGRTMGVIELRYPPERVSSTTHTLEVYLDAPNAIQELNEENNRIALPVVVSSTFQECEGQRVDLFSSSRHCGECLRTCAAGYQCQSGSCQYGMADFVVEGGQLNGRIYGFTVRNAGTAAVVRDVPIRFDIDGQTITLSWPGSSSSPINNGSETLYSQQMPEGFNTQDPHRISITIDPENVVEEQDELNNQWVQRTGASALLLTLRKQESNLSLLSVSSITTDVPVETAESGEYVAELTEYSEEATEPVERTLFTIPTETRLNQESGGGWQEQEVTGGKTLVVALPVSGAPHRLTIRENGVEQPVIQVAFHRDGTLEEAAAAQTKTVGLVRTVWQKTRDLTKKMMCATFGRISRLRGFFGCE